MWQKTRVFSASIVFGPSLLLILPECAGIAIATVSTMVKFGKARRAQLAKQCSDGANLAAAALMFGQYVRGRDFAPAAFASGLVLWLLLGAAAVLIAGKEDS